MSGLKGTGELQLVNQVYLALFSGISLHSLSMFLNPKPCINHTAASCLSEHND